MPTEIEKAQDAAIEKASRTTLDRTTAGILYGNISTPRSQLNPEQQLTLEKATVREQWSKGQITRTDALRRLGLADQKWVEQSHERTMRFAETAKRKAVSETTKQDTQRELAQRQGVAVGTINKDGSGSISNQSRTANNVKVSNFVEAQKQSMSNYNKQQNKSYEVTLKEGEKKQEIQGPVKPNYNYEVTLTENQKQDSFNSPYGNLDFTYGNKNNKVGIDYEKGNLLQNIGADFYNSLRYSDRVANKEVEPPKGLELFPYYASQGLSVFYNIPLNLMGDKKTQPTLADTIFDTGVELATKGKTKTHDPIGDYIRKDPIGVLSQLPAEAALWITGSKAVGVASKAFKSFSPIQYQAAKILTNEGKVSTEIRSITVNNKPVISIQNKGIQKGYDPLKIKYESINAKTRDGFEASVGSGIQKEIFYSPKALQSQVNRGIIPDIAKTRATAWVKALDQAKGVTSKGGTLGKEPIEGLTQKQSDSIFKGIGQGQKEGSIEAVKGSTATKASIPEAIQQEAGSSLKLGDVDILPKGKNLKAVSDRLIQGFAADFPLSPGQRLSIKNLGAGDDANRALELTSKKPLYYTGKGKDRKPVYKAKILEVVLQSSEESKYGISKGNKILDQNIPFDKSVKVKDYPIRTKTADYQLLTNVKQALAYQTGKETLLDIYTSSGRSKDIIRGYWNLRAKAVFKGGDEGKALEKQANYIRSLYNLDFTDYRPEKVLLYSSKAESKSSSGISKGISQTPLKGINPKSENSFEKNIEEIKQSSKNIKQTQSSFGFSRYTPRPTGRSINMLSNHQRRITQKINGSSLSASNKPRSYGNIKIPLSNRPIKDSIKDKPSIFDKSIKNSSITGDSSTKYPPSIKNPPPKQPINKVLGRIPQSRGLENPYREFQKRKPVGFIPFDIKNTTKKAPGFESKGHDFIGNSSISSVSGIYKKSEIRTGDKKTERIYKNTLFKESKKGKTKGLLGMNKKSKTSFW